MMKRVVVAGCRNYTNYREAKDFIDTCLSDIRKNNTIIIVSGGCQGADLLGERYALENGFTVEKHPAQWQKYGRSAGPKRNLEMAEISDVVICFWDGKSKGTKSMIQCAQKCGKPVRVKIVEVDNRLKKLS